MYLIGISTDISLMINNVEHIYYVLIGHLCVFLCEVSAVCFPIFNHLLLLLLLM